jgi:hypothetical protein
MTPQQQKKRGNELSSDSCALTVNRSSGAYNNKHYPPPDKPTVTQNIEREKLKKGPIHQCLGIILN